MHWVHKPITHHQCLTTLVPATSKTCQRGDSSSERTGERRVLLRLPSKILKQRSVPASHAFTAKLSASTRYLSLSDDFPGETATVVARESMVTLQYRSIVAALLIAASAAAHSQSTSSPPTGPCRCGRVRGQPAHFPGNTATPIPFLTATSNFATTCTAPSVRRRSSPRPLEQD